MCDLEPTIDLQATLAISRSRSRPPPTSKRTFQSHQLLSEKHIVKIYLVLLYSEIPFEVLTLNQSLTFTCPWWSKSRSQPQTTHVSSFQSIKYIPRLVSQIFSHYSYYIGKPFLTLLWRELPFYVPDEVPKRNFQIMCTMMPRGHFSWKTV